MLNKPVYLFLGYKLLLCKYVRTDNSEIEKFSIKIIKSEYLKETKVYSLVVFFSLKFEQCDESEFTFGSGFQINDEDWLSKLEDNQRNGLFLSIVFPFIREKIHNITDDSRGSFLLPIIDLRNIDLNEGIIFTANKQ